MGNGVTGSTGKEVVILDVFEGTGGSISHGGCVKPKLIHEPP